MLDKKYINHLRQKECELENNNHNISKIEYQMRRTNIDMARQMFYTRCLNIVPKETERLRYA